jgi:RNA polymerase I-specific transcription initiation factor RRN7
LLNVIVAEQILQLFPLSDLPPKAEEGSDYEQRVERLKDVQKSLIVQKPKPVEVGESEEIKRSGELYKRYRTVEELPENAKAFYRLAGEFFSSSYDLRLNLSSIERGNLGENACAGSISI